jgi:hypothetical protein
MGTVWGQPISIERRKTNPYNNDSSTAVTIAQMRALAHQCSSDPSVRAAVQQACSRGVRSQRDIASACFYWVRKNVKFIEDEQLMFYQLGIPEQQLDKELLIIPPVLLSMPQPMGDCDDFALLLASMLLSAGLRPFFVTLAADDEDARKWSHIYICCRLEDEGTHLCLDAGNKFENVAPGMEWDSPTRKAAWLI